jgi:signal peptidase I
MDHNLKNRIVHSHEAVQSTYLNTPGNALDSSPEQTQPYVSGHSLAPQSELATGLTNAPQTPPENSVGWFLVREVMQVVLPALLLAVLIHMFLAQATVVYGRSMEPNLYESQRLIIDKVSYRFRSPQRNDIVVLDLPYMDEMLVKRIVGLPGETLEVRNGQVLVNNVPLPETFPHHLTEYDTLPITLGPLNYFVLGDNRGNSNDSRTFGAVERESIVGRVWLRYWPLRQIKFF